MSSANRTTSRVYDALAVAPRGRFIKGRSADLDVMRAVAALLVVANHAVLIGGSPYAETDRSVPALLYHGSGALGVSLFFALSGFLIAGPFLRGLMADGSTPEVKRYFWRRATRILPAYWVALTAAIVVITPANGVHWWEIPVHYGLVQNLLPGESVALLLVAWSLCIEATFYVLVPLGAWAVRRFRSPPMDIGFLARAIFVVWGIAAIYGLVVAVISPSPGDTHDILVTSLPGFLPCFCPGLLVYLAETDAAARRGGLWALYRRLVRRGWFPLALAVIVSLGGELAYTSSSAPIVDAGKHFNAVASGLALAGVCQGLGWMRSGVKVLAPLGLVSYGIYLWHWIVVESLIRHPSAVPLPGSGFGRYLVHFGFVTAITLALALLSWLVVERPILRWHQARGDRAAPVTRAAPSEAIV